MFFLYFPSRCLLFSLFLLSSCFLASLLFCTDATRSRTKTARPIRAIVAWYGCGQLVLRAFWHGLWWLSGRTPRLMKRGSGLSAVWRTTWTTAQESALYDPCDCYSSWDNFNAVVTALRLPPARFVTAVRKMFCLSARGQVHGELTELVCARLPYKADASIEVDTPHEPPDSCLIWWMQSVQAFWKHDMVHSVEPSQGCVDLSTVYGGGTIGFSRRGRVVQERQWTSVNSFFDDLAIADFNVTIRIQRNGQWQVGFERMFFRAVLEWGILWIQGLDAHAVSAASLLRVSWCGRFICVSHCLLHHQDCLRSSFHNIWESWGSWRSWKTL